MKGVFFRGDNVINKPIFIEIDKPIEIPIHSVQFDKNSRFINVYLLNNSLPLDVTRYTVTVAGVKPDGQEFFNECDKINSEEGLVRFEITEQMNVSTGIVNCEIKVYNDSEGVLTTKPFSIKVTRSLLKSDIESTGEFRALTEAISKVQGFDNKLVDLRNDTNEKFAQTNAQLSVVKDQSDSLNYYVHPHHGSRKVVMERNVDFNSKYFRIPFMTVCKDGTIVAGGDIRYNGGADHGFISLGAKRSTDGGKTWENPVVAIANKGVDTQYSRCMDGTILYNETLDKLFLLGNSWKTGDTGWSLVQTEGRDPNWDVLLSTSSDRGRSWSTPISLASLLPNGYNAFIGGVGQGIVMGNGTMVFPIQINPTGKASGDGRTKSGIIYSVNDGSSWQMSASFTDMPCSECMIVEWGGALWLNCRSDNNEHRMIYKTTNLGATWTYVQNLSEASESGVSCQGSIITVPYGQEVYVLSSNPKEKTERTALTIKVMNRSASDWIDVTVVYPWGYDGYSCLAYDKWNQKLYIIYECGNLMFEDVTYILPTLKGLYSKGVNNSTYTKNHLGSKNANIYIDVINGSDNNEGGSQIKPVKTFERVSEIARKYKNSYVHLMQSDISSVDLTLTNIPGNVQLNLLNASGVPYVSVGSAYIRGCGDVRFNFTTRLTRMLKAGERYYAIALEDSRVQCANEFQFPLFVRPENGVTAYYTMFADGSSFSSAHVSFYDTEEGEGKIPSQCLAFLQRNKCDLTFVINASSKLPTVPKPYILSPDNIYVNHRVNIADINSKNYYDYDGGFKRPLTELWYNHYCSTRSNVHESVNNSRTVTNVYLNGNVHHLSFSIYFNELSNDLANGTVLFRLPTIATPKITQYLTGVAYKFDSTGSKVVGEYGITLQVRHDTGNVETVGILPTGVAQIICSGVLA